MANTYTPTYNLLKPEVGADTNAWGTHLNSDLDTIDANMVSRVLTSAQTFAGAINLPSDGLNVGSGQLLVTGGNVTMSGTLTATGAATLSSTLTVGSTTNLQAGLNVTGATAISSTLSVTGATTLAANGLNVGSGQLNVTGGNVAMSGSLTVTGSITSGAHTASSLTISGDTALNGSITFNNYATINYSGAGALSVNTSNNVGGLIFYNGGTATGRYGSNTSYPFYVQTGGGTAILYSDTSGNLTASANITAYSDARLKQNVVTINDALSLVSRMRGVFYDRIDSGKAGVGVIAQEMRKVIPQAVQENDGTLSVAYGNLVGVLIEAIKEIESRLKILETAQ